MNNGYKSILTIVIAAIVLATLVHFAPSGSVFYMIGAYFVGILQALTQSGIEK